jgi:error-prone DNA polymerase
VSTDHIALDHSLVEDVRAAVGDGEVGHFFEQAARARLKDLSFAKLLDEIQAEVGPIPDELMAEADAFRALGMDRRDALWAVKGLAAETRHADAPLLAAAGMAEEAPVQLPLMALTQHVAEDYRTTSLSLKAHPCSFFREDLKRHGAVTAQVLQGLRDRTRTSVGGLVLVRQRPGTAKGVVFLTLEDETGVANCVVWKDVFAQHRRTVMRATFLVVHGRLQKEGEVVHLVAETFTDLSGLLATLKQDGSAPKQRHQADAPLVHSRDFH